MEMFRQGAFTKKEQEVLGHPEVKKALESYRDDRNPANRHKLNTWLREAGMDNPKKRQSFIDRLMKMRRYGDG